MNTLRELTTIIERLNGTASFQQAADMLVEWARGLTTCGSAMLRLLETAGQPHGLDSAPWLAGCAAVGGTETFLKDETVVGDTDCLCGRVASNATDPDLPFYTEAGSFVWGRLGSLLDDFDPELLGPLRGACIREGFESLGIFPLRADGRVVGSLHLADVRRDAFAGTAEVVEAACSLAGDVLWRHRSHEREQALLDLVQTALLPATPPPISRLRIGVSFSSASELARLGGDFYDVLDLGHAGVLIMVGDVSGKGVESAGIAARARHALDAHASVTPDPASFMSAANESLRHLLPSGRFVTAAACLIDPGSGRMTTCLAGHPSPLRLGSGRGVETSAPPNPPLGVFAGLRFEEADDLLADDDTLLIYTDGVSDSRRDGTVFGLEGIIGAARRSADGEPEQVARVVCSVAGEYHDETLPGDDRLVMAVRRHA